MKPGRFWFSEPSPYVTHEPKLGRTCRTSPQFIIISDGSWFGMSVYIERMTHRSSTHSPTFGKISLTSMPLWPYFLKLNGDGNAAPVRRSVFSVIGIGLPANSRQRRLRIEGVDVRRAAVHEQVQDALRLGGERRLLRSERIDRRI